MARSTLKALAAVTMMAMVAFSLYLSFSLLLTIRNVHAREAPTDVVLVMMKRWKTGSCSDGKSWPAHFASQVRNIRGQIVGDNRQGHGVGRQAEVNMTWKSNLLKFPAAHSKTNW